MTPRKPASGPQAGEDDLAILHPDVTVEIAGRSITVREYRFLDGQRARAKGKPLIDDITVMLESGRVVDAVIEDYIDLLARHDSLILELMADSVVGADRDWIDGLSYEDGQVLLLNWWGVCGRFFVRIVVCKLAEQAIAQVQRSQATQSGGSKFSMPSPEPATARPTNSSATSPSVN